MPFVRLLLTGRVTHRSGLLKGGKRSAPIPLPTSAAKYFADKQALLTALALEGFEKVAKRLDSTVPRDPLTALRKILLDYIAYAEENPNEYRILFRSVETLGELKLSREDL